MYQKVHLTTYTKLYVKYILIKLGKKLIYSLLLLSFPTIWRIINLSFFGDFDFSFYVHKRSKFIKPTFNITAFFATRPSSLVRSHLFCDLDNITLVFPILERLALYYIYITLYSGIRKHFFSKCESLTSAFII